MNAYLIIYLVGLGLTTVLNLVVSTLCYYLNFTSKSLTWSSFIDDVKTSCLIWNIYFILILIIMYMSCGSIIIE